MLNKDRPEKHEDIPDSGEPQEKFSLFGSGNGGRTDSGSAAVDTVFIQEKIKQRPPGRRKLVRFVLTAVTAAVFGILASFSFLLLEPLFKKQTAVSDSVRTVVFSEETPTEEISPSDLIESDEALSAGTYDASAAAAAQSETASAGSTQIDREVRKILEEQDSGILHYRQVYEALQARALEVQAGLAVVSGLSSDYDLFSESYEDAAQASGVIAADNGVQYLILVPSSILEGAQTIQVSFSNGESASASLLASADEPALSVIGVSKEDLSKECCDSIKVASLGSSLSQSLTGSPVIAVGSPTGNSGSVMYGAVTEVTHVPDIVDLDCTVLATDMYGSSTASGVLVTLSGLVIGLIDENYNTSEMPNRICALGISSLKPLIQRLSNDETPGKLGIYGTDITENIASQKNIPSGVFVRQTLYDSPAMNSGIQSGDIITELNGEPVKDYRNLSREIILSDPGTVFTFTLLRSGSDGYYPVTVDAELN